MAPRGRPWPPSHKHAYVSRRLQTRRCSRLYLLKHTSCKNLDEKVGDTKRKGGLFSIIDDVKIATPLAVIGEIVDSFAEVTWQEAGLATQVVKNRIYAQPSAGSGWTQYLESTSRNPSALLPIHDIHDGSLLSDPSDPDSTRLLPDADGFNVVGTPLGTSDFIESYMDGKGFKLKQLLSFIQDVASAGFPREAVVMLTGAVGPHLTHMLKSVERNPRTERWMKEMDEAHVSSWLHCLTASPDLGNALDTGERDQLSAWLDLPSFYGGSGLNSLSRSADEEFLGSFAAIFAYLIAF